VSAKIAAPLIKSAKISVTGDLRTIRPRLAIRILVTVMIGQGIANAQEPPKKPPPAKPAPAARPVGPPSQPPPSARPATPPRQGPSTNQTTVTPGTQRLFISPQNTTSTAPSSTSSQRNRTPPFFSAPAGQARALSVRGASRATIAGRNFSIRRDSYRVRRGDRWLTFLGIGALHAMMIGPVVYYPYAYIDAPDDYCQGWTEDGCQLFWLAVPTEEGPSDFQCVAYCPWQ